jgi:hypothetical protein
MTNISKHQGCPRSQAGDNRNPDRLCNRGGPGRNGARRVPGARRNSTFTYKGRAVDVKQVGRELGVGYVLEGSVRKAGERVRITGQLIDTATGAHVWASSRGLAVSGRKKS